MRWIVGLSLSVGICLAQSPDVRLHLDLYGSYDGMSKNSGSLRLYSPLGDASTLQISVLIEPGLRAFVSEQFVPFPRDPSNDPFQQYYVEDEGIWRLGKQFLPFGSGNLVRENVLAARGQTNLLFENTTLAAAVCDGGEGDQMGIIGRIGGRFGVSAAVGRHFGISPTSFDVIRSPEDSPGSGRGWKQMIDADGTRRFGRFTTTAEAVWLLSGETTLDKSQAVVDLLETFQSDRTHQYSIGYSYATLQSKNYIRATAHIPMTKTTDLEPLLRYRDGKLWDIAATFHVHL